MKKKTPEQFLEVLRGSFHDSVMVYRFGGCYGLYQILKYIYPTATAYFENDDKDHILTKIDNAFYEIKGECKNTKYVIKLTSKDHVHWRKVANGQRLELILAKHDSFCKKLAQES